MNYKLNGFFINEGDFPVSKEGSLFIGWLEMKLKESIESENFEEALKLEKTINNYRETCIIIK